MTVTARLDKMLQVLKTRHRLRQLSPRQGLDFSSNNYLGLAGSELMRRAAQNALDRGVPLGSGGSRLLRGNHPEHEALEAEAAAFFGSEAALFMGGGFQCNQAIFSTLPAAGDLILYDELVHASTHEGMRLGRAETQSFPHNDVHGARQVLSDWRTTGHDGQVWISVESVYSMDGDFAPLRELVAFARSEDAMLVVDEAHATGVFGPHGQGLTHKLEDEVLTLHTCGKALGVSGGLICGSKSMVDTLINRARLFLFATAPSPFNAALVRAALRALQEDSCLTDRVHDRIAHAHSEAQRLCGLRGFQSQILPVIIGMDEPTMARATQLQQLGFDVRGIRPPTVPRGTSRLRISISNNVTSEEITALFQAIANQQTDWP